MSRSAGFRKAVLQEAVDCLLTGDIDTGQFHELKVCIRGIGETETTPCGVGTSTPLKKPA